MTADIIKPIAVTRMEMPTKIPTVQADTGRKIIFVMTDLDIPKGGTAQIFAIKPSGAEVYNNCAVGNLSTGASTVEVKLTSAMLEEPGEFPAQVQVVSGEDVITTFEFIISNARSLIKKGVTEGTNEYNALIQATKDAEDAARAANEATKKADTAAEDANDAASAASRAEINANNAASVANSAAGAANATVGPAVNATEAANDAAKAANEAAKKAEAAAGGEISEKTVTFQEAVERANIESGDTLSVAFGKLAKYCADFEKVVENVNELNTKNVTVHGILIETTNQTFDVPVTCQDVPYLVAAQIQLTDGVWSDLRTLNDIVRIDNNQNQIALIKQNAAAYVNYQVRFLLYVK